MTNVTPADTEAACAFLEAWEPGPELTQDRLALAFAAHREAAQEALKAEWRAAHTPLRQGPSRFGKYSRYALPDMQIGEVKEFYGLTADEGTRLRRSAHNYNARSDLKFYTRTKSGVVYVTRLR